jgi:hypothetical protein
MELFEFLRFMKVQGLLQDMAMRTAKAGEDG